MVAGLAPAGGEGRRVVAQPAQLHHLQGWSEAHYPGVPGAVPGGASSRGGEAGAHDGRGRCRGGRQTLGERETQYTAQSLNM